MSGTLPVSGAANSEWKSTAWSHSRPWRNRLTRPLDSKKQYICTMVTPFCPGKRTRNCAEESFSWVRWRCFGGCRACGGVHYFICDKRVDFRFRPAQFEQNLDAMLTGHRRRPQIP
jgi:hypothetical protein